MPSANTISFEYRPNGDLDRCARVLGCCALLGPWLSAAPGWCCLLLNALLSLALWRRSRMTQLPQAWIWEATGDWYLCAEREPGAAWQLHHYRRWGHSLVLQLVCGRQRRSLWLGPRQVSATDLRHLRVRLQLAGIERALERHLLS